MGQKLVLVIVLILMVGCGAAPPITPPTPTAGTPSMPPVTDEIRVDGPEALRRVLRKAAPGQ